MKRITVASVAFVALSLFISMAPAVPNQPPVDTPQKLTIDNFVAIVLSQGDRALTAFNTFENATLSSKVSYRQTRLPQLSATSSFNAAREDVSSVVTRNKSATGATVLSQPVYPLGGDLSLRMEKTESQAGINDWTGVDPTYSAALTQPVPLFVGNTKWRAWRRSSIAYALAQESYRREVQSIEKEARSKYFDVLLQLKTLDVEKAKLESSQRMHNIVEAMVDAGRYAGIELARSKTRLQTDRRRIENATTSLKQSINDALSFASLKIGSSADFVSSINFVPLRMSVDRLTEFALNHRPDYLAAQRQLELSELTVRETLEQNNPNINMSASYSRSAALSDATKIITRNWTGGLNLSWLLFDSRIVYLEAKAARNNLINDRIALRNLERNIRNEVANAYLGIKTYESQFSDLEESRDLARQNVEVVRTRYQNGRDRLVDVFDSENELRSIELEYLGALISASKAKDSLELTIGGRLAEVAQ